MSTVTDAFQLDRGKFRAALADHAAQTTGADVDFGSLRISDYSSEEYALDDLSDGLGALLDVACGDGAVTGPDGLSVVAYAINGAYTHSITIMIEHAETGLRISRQSINTLDLHPELSRLYEPVGVDAIALALENLLAEANEILAQFRAHAAAFGV